MEPTEFLLKISYYAIPVLCAITLHEVAHGWMARSFGDRTAELLGRLSLNPLRHIDPFGTLVVPALLLFFHAPAVIGWAKPVPVSTASLQHPQRALFLVALAGPAANILMAALWCALLAVLMHVNGELTLVSWVASMAKVGVYFNAILAAFNLLPIPPLDGGRMLSAVVPARWRSGLEKIEPVGLLVVLGLSALGLLSWLFDPTLRVVGLVLNSVFGSRA